MLLQLCNLSFNIQTASEPADVDIAESLGFYSIIQPSR